MQDNAEAIKQTPEVTVECLAKSNSCQGRFDC